MKIKNKNKFLKFITPFSFLIFGLLPWKIFAQWDLGELDDFGLSNAPIAVIISGIAAWLLGILEVVSLIAFIVAGIWYLTAAGDDKQIERAKKAMLYSIIGVIVGLSGYVIVQAIDLMLKGSSGF